MSDVKGFMQRTIRCGELLAEHIGQEVVLNGWVHRNRDHGGLVFVDLRDRAGLAQVVFDPAASPEAHAIGQELRSEYVVAVKGTVRRRPDGAENPELATGEVEVLVSEAQVLNAAKTTPFSITDRTETDELIRLKYRYIDLRDPRMQANLALRAKAAGAARDFLTAEGFLEVETPILFKPTPEGARDYLVPSRVNPGNFYALPQSPQLMKQLLMVAGIDRYFQLARCFRDEDLRADRQPEHTQIDMEMSFVTREDILDVTERMIASIFEQTIDYKLPRPFPRMTHAEALRDYGSDKPDIRFGMKHIDLSDIAEKCQFKVFHQAVAQGGKVRGINCSGQGDLSRAQLDKLTDFAKQHKAQGLAWMRVTADGADSPIAKFFAPEELAAILARFEAKPGDLLLMVADTTAIVAESLDWVRREMAGRMGLIDPDVFAPLWVLDFPMFAWSDEENRWLAEHHPFCMPYEDDFDIIESDPGKVRAQAYDIVINGTELASGSIRIHRGDIQQRIFRILGITPEQAEAKFGFLLHAFDYGTPPHGGIAPGFDRLVMMLAKEDNIREVIAFPKTQRGQDLMSGAPSPADAQALGDLHIKVDLPPSG